MVSTMPISVLGPFPSLSHPGPAERLLRSWFAPAVRLRKRAEQTRPQPLLLAKVPHLRDTKLGSRQRAWKPAYNSYLSNASPSNLLTQSGDLQSATRPTGVPSFRSRIAIDADERTRRRRERGTAVRLDASRSMARFELLFLAPIPHCVYPNFSRSPCALH